MSLKRFCDLCHVEINRAERFYDVVLTVKLNARTAPYATGRGEFCYGCARSGKALGQLMERADRSTGNVSDVSEVGGVSQT